MKKELIVLAVIAMAMIAVEATWVMIWVGVMARTPMMSSEENTMPFKMTTMDPSARARGPKMKTSMHKRPRKILMM